jgi:hypothetical protein
MKKNPTQIFMERIMKAMDEYSLEIHKESIRKGIRKGIEKRKESRADKRNKYLPR